MAEVEDTDKFYQDAHDYWKGIPATVDGVLGGFGHISNTDIQGSVEFLSHFIRGNPPLVESNRAVDCGAGIGRITKRLLAPRFNQVDLVEFNQGFLNQAKVYLKDEAEKVRHYHCCGLQDFSPPDGEYDVIWCQWVLGHLTDEHLIAFFKRCQKGLATNGIICVKENVGSTEEVDFDEIDSSFTRPKDALVDIFKKSGLTILEEKKQKRMPKGLYDVWMFALQ